VKVLSKWILVLACAGFSAPSLAGQTADYEDIYLMGTAGWRSGDELQFSAGAGYVFTEGFGLGAVYEYSANNPFAVVELRWFLEPFESAIGAGIESRDTGIKRELSPLFTICGDYLFSITPSMALRASVKWLLPLENRSGVFTGGGFRILF
jgi:hypothetical protein